MVSWFSHPFGRGQLSTVEHVVTQSVTGPTLSVVIPCYNEEDVLEELFQRVFSVCKDVVGDDFEVVFVDDGSRDWTRTILTKFSERDPRAVCVFLARNHGHQLALTAGLRQASGERILVLDADLQDPPELLGEMMLKMDEGYDVVYGQRRSREGETAFKKLSARMFYRLMRKMSELELPLDAGDFRLMSKRVNDILCDMPEQDRFIRGMVSWIGLRQTSIEYDRAERFAGETKYPLRRMLRFAADAITGFSVIPLKIATWTGFAMAFFSLIVLIYTLIGWAFGQTVSGWTSVMVAVLLIGGIQMVTIGILGEYLGRLYMQSKQRPLFIIDQVLNARTAERPVSKPVRFASGRS